MVIHTKEWHTQEAYNYIANDEDLYFISKRAKTVARLRSIWNMVGPSRKLNKKLVDWKQLFEDLKEL